MLRKDLPSFQPLSVKVFKYTREFFLPLSGRASLVNFLKLPLSPRQLGRSELHMSRSGHCCGVITTILPGSVVSDGHWLVSLVHLISRGVQKVLPFTSLHILLPEVGGLLS